MGRRRVRVSVVAGLAILAGCTDGNSAASVSTVSTTSSSVPTSVPIPPPPSGVENCGVVNEMSGWPTTMAPPIDHPVATCVGAALATGSPAWIVHVYAGRRQSPEKTRDGYDIPVKIVATYRVLGPDRVEVVTDRRADGGHRTRRLCTGIEPRPMMAPRALGCGEG